MTFEEKGAYMELLMLQFNRGHMTSHMIGRTVGQLWDNIKDKFIEDAEGLFYNVRLELEQTKRKAYSDSRRNNTKGTNQHNKPKPKKVGHMDGHMEDEDESKDLSSLNKKGVDNLEDEILPLETEFDLFWKAYGSERGLVPCQREWSTIDHAEYPKIIEHAPRFVKASGSYQKLPINYLKERCWQDKQLPNYADKSKAKNTTVLVVPTDGYGKNSWDE